MKEKKEKILENVFIPAGENNLRLCNIYFDEKVQKVVPLTECLFRWNEIQYEHQRKNLAAQFLAGKIKDNVISGNYLIAVPGGIDPHVHFNTPGFEFRDTFEEASLAAACGGVTTIIDMPCTSIPPVTNLENFNVKLDAVKNKSYVDFAFWGGIPGNDFNAQRVERNVKELVGAGVAGFKVYMISGMETFKDLSDEEILTASRLVSETGKPLAVHAEDKKTINSALEKYYNAGLTGWQSYCYARSIKAESEAVRKLAAAAKQSGCRIHVVHLSSGDGLEIIKRAAGEGLLLSAETCPHYLHFTQESFKDETVRNYLKTAPPVKLESDKEALWRGLSDGSVIFITTDHAGCDPDKEKSSSDFSKVYGGIPGVEHRMPFLFSEGFLKGKIDLEKTINLLSTNAANYFGLKGKGYIKEGYDADFALIDLWTAYTVHGTDMHSKGKYTPFEGIKFNASVKKTFLRGNLIAEKNSGGNTAGIPAGKFIYV